MTANRGSRLQAPSCTSSMPKSMNSVPIDFDPSRRTTEAPTAIPNGLSSMSHILRPLISRT